MRSNDYLFRGVDSFSVQRQQTESMKSEIARMDANRLLNTNVDDLVGYLAEKYGIEVPELIEGEMVVDQCAAQRDMSGDPMRRFFYDRHQGPIMVTGTEILLEVPFSGDPQMFQVQPSTYNMNPSQGTVQGNILTTTLWGDNLNADQARGHINTWVGEVRQHLQWQRDSFGNFNGARPASARCRRTSAGSTAQKPEPRREPGYSSKKAAGCPRDVRGPRGEAKARAEATSGDGRRV
jgi:hypothetical protein